MSEVTPPLPASAGDWVTVFRPQPVIGRVIEPIAIWGHTVYRIWLPQTNEVIRAAANEVGPVSATPFTVHHLGYLAAAARIAEALSSDLLLAPLEAPVIPLPHQMYALRRALAGERVRFLLADEVGLGKTIEAGLIMRELKLRGWVRRALVVAPKGLAAQWQAELALHFNERFTLITSDDYKSWKRQVAAQNPFQAFDQVIVTLDTVKPPSGAEGAAWERFEDLIAAGWDLVIVDEAHRLAGSTEQVARYRLGQALADAAPHLLLLSATPHQGKTDAFHRLMALLDPAAFPDLTSISRERVQPYVIRTEKRRAVDSEGRLLFQPRRTELAPIAWQARHEAQRVLYEAVTDYVREGYNRAQREKRSYLGFLMILMQRLVVSSTRAIRATLERRLELLAAGLPAGASDLDPDAIHDLDGEELREALLYTAALGHERREVVRLLELARRCEQVGPDAKAEALLAWIYRLQAETGDPNLKVLVFVEFTPTQAMLAEFLRERGFTVECLNGAMDIAERKRVQMAFAGDTRILISTDAGGEGLNLQFCHVVINYDIPWNPMRLEQRIGRVDRIGQRRVVRAINFVFEESVEYRVREVLEQKLAVIFAELGIDKTGDVLDSAQAGRLFDDLYVETLLHPEAVETKVTEVVNTIAAQARAAQQSYTVLDSGQDFDLGEAQRLLAHPLPHWVERMVTNYVQAYGGSAERQLDGWALRWPTGEQLVPAVFTAREAAAQPSAHYLTVEAERVRDLIAQLPQMAPGQPAPILIVPGLAADLSGYWSLWEITLRTHHAEGADDAALRRQRRFLPLFVTDDDRVFAPTARRVWEQLLVAEPIVTGALDPVTAQQTIARLWPVAERYGRSLYEELWQRHQATLARERDKIEYAFTARRNALERIGLAQVRSYRLNRLEQERRQAHQRLAALAQVWPELRLLALARIGGIAHGELA